MIFAELHGKLGSECQLATDRSEDLLTSTAFQLLRYVPLERGFLPLLRSARPTSDTWLTFGSSDEIAVELWPRFKGAGCPDVVLRLLSKGKLKQVVLIEVKLYSPKSGTASDNKVEPEPELLDQSDAQENSTSFNRDQLARYWQGLMRHSEFVDVEKCVIFLTSHATPPRDDLTASLAQDRSMLLGWLSWYDVWRIADEAGRGPDGCAPARDLADLLKHRHLASFSGFRMVDFPWTELTTARFFADKMWFGGLPVDFSGARHFWRRA